LRSTFSAVWVILDLAGFGTALSACGRQCGWGERVDDEAVAGALAAADVAHSGCHDGPAIERRKISSRPRRWHRSLGRYWIMSGHGRSPGLMLVLQAVPAVGARARRSR